MVGTGTSHFLQSNTSTETNSNPKHGMKHMSMNQSVGWVGGEAPVSEFWQFQNRLEPCRGTSPGLWGRAVTLIDKLLRMKAGSVQPRATAMYHSRAAAPTQGSDTAGASPWHSSVCHQHALTACLAISFFFLEKTFCLKLLNTLSISLSYSSNKEIKNKYLLADVLCRWMHAWVRTTDWPSYNCIYWTGWKN